MILVDSCVLIDVFTDDKRWKEWSLDALDRCVNDGKRLAINPIIYGEISLDFDSASQLDSTLDEFGLEVLEIPRPALFAAARAFVEYRRKGGAKTNTLPDFYIGAHARELGVELITRDARRFRTYFPGVSLVEPDV